MEGKVILLSQIATGKLASLTLELELLKQHNAQLEYEHQSTTHDETVISTVSFIVIQA